MKQTSFTPEAHLVNLNVRVPRSLWRRVRLQSLREGQLLRTFITEALEEHMHMRVRRPRKTA